MDEPRFKIYRRPIPPKRGNRKGRPLKTYPFGAMQVGQCFDVEVSGMSAQEILIRISCAARGWAKRRGLGDGAFTVRISEDSSTVTIWRVK